jgi:hypothetical protein
MSKTAHPCDLATRRAGYGTCPLASEQAVWTQT